MRGHPGDELQIIDRLQLGALLAPRLLAETSGRPAPGRAILWGPFGLAPDGICPASNVATRAVSSYLAISRNWDVFTMPLPSSGGIAETQILTLNGDFGAYLVPAGSGVVLNNSLSDFNSKVKPGGFGRASLPAPGKRPLSSMTPTIIAKNGKPHWVIGSPGGQTIISTKRICSLVRPTRAAPMAWQPAFEDSFSQRIKKTNFLLLLFLNMQIVYRRYL